MKKHLLRTLVVALMTMIGGNAWADNYFTQDYEGDGVTADWTSGNTGRYTVDMKATEDPANNYLTVNAVGNGNNGTTITSTSVAGKVANDKDFTMEFDLQITNGNNQASSFYVYDSANDASKAFFALVAPSTGTKWNIQGSADHQVELAKNTWYTFKIAKSAGITYLTLTNKATGDKLEDQAIIPTLSEAGGLGNMVFNTKRYYAYMAIDNVVVRDVESTDAPASTPTTYTLKYVDGNSTALKEDVIINSIVGIEVAASSDQIADFKTGEGDNQKKWIYVSGNNSITTVEAAESNVITLVYREAEKFSYTFTAKSGDLLLETYPVATGFELDNIKVPYHHYYFTDGKIYQKGATSSEYNYSFILDSNNKEVGINDYAILEKENVIFFAEAENLKALTPITDGLQASRNSFAAGAFASEYVPFITLAPGTYTLTAAGYGGTYSFMNGETSVLNMEQAGYWREITSEEFTLETSTDITFKGGVGATGALDYIYIQSTNGSAKEYEKPFDPATAIVNAGFNPEADPLGWDKVTSAQYYDLGMGLIGTYQVRGEHPAATVDETHLATEFAAGLECRWQTNYAAFTQTTTELPAGAYKLTFDVENTNATTTKANYENRFNVTVGETTYADESTEWMDGKSAWTTHTIAFTLTEASPITISLGYGTGSNNFGVGNTPALFVSHLTLEAINSIEIALIDLQAAIEAAQAKAATYTVGTEFFTYAESEIKPLNDAIATAQAAYTAAESAEAVKSATETLNAFVATFAPVMNKPAADKTYSFQLRLDGETPLYMALAEGGITIAEEATPLKFVAVEGAEGQYNLSNEDGTLFVGLAGGNAWTMSTLADQKAAWTFTALPDGAYRINNLVTAGRFVGTNAADKEAGKPCYADKQTSNGNVDWLIAEYVAPEPVKTDYTDYIANADLTGEGGFDATGTKGIDGSGIVKVGNAAAFDFKQTIENLPAGKYKVTAQAAYRYGGDEQAEYNAMQTENTITKFVQLYATVGTTTVDTLVQNRYDGASETNLFNGEGGVSVVNEKYVPNSSDAVKAWFAAGQYVNEVIFNLPADGAVTIGINRTGTPESDYTVIGPWTLTRLGDAEVEPEPTPEPGADYTSYIVNPSFEDGTTGWTYEPSNDHGAKENSNATYAMSNCDGDHMFNIWSSGNAISQKVVNLPNGVYKMQAVIATDANQKVQLNANDKSVQIEAVGKETGVEGELEFNVLDNTATIGAEGVNKYWYKVDNFRLTYVKGFDTAELVTAYETALAEAQAIEGDMNADVKTALDAAIATEVDKTNADALTSATAALTAATSAAKASVAAFAKAKEILPKMKELVDATNVYTAEAYENYYSKWVAKLDEKTLTAEEGNALQDPFIVTGWRASITVDNFLLSAWDTNPDFQDAPYYINSWSTEGENDGSNFKVPFFEYWTGDANSLGERTLTATMSNLPEGEYDVTAWVRVRMKNGAEAPTYGIALQANDGEAVDVCDGEAFAPMYVKEVTATGTVAADGVLKIKFNVAADNNISWLSFKNVKFEKKAAAEESDEIKVTYALKVDETHASADVVEVKNEEEEVVATLTFGEAGGAEFKAAKADAHIEGFEAFTEGNGTNGNKEGGTFYTIVPKFDGKVDVAVVLNADKSFYISEDGTALADFDGITVDEKMYGTFTFNVKAEKTYKVYAAGTKLGFYGFNYTYKEAKQPEPEPLDPDLVVIPQSQSPEVSDGANRADVVEGDGYIQYTTKADISVIIKMLNIDVKDCDYVVVKFAEPVPAGINIAFWNGNENVAIPEGATEYKYVFAEDANCAIANDVLPQICMLTLWNEGKVVKISGVYKHKVSVPTGINTINTAIQNGNVYNMNGQKVNKAKKGLYIINGKKVVIK